MSNADKLGQQGDVEALPGTHETGDEVLRRSLAQYDAVHGAAESVMEGEKLPILLYKDEIIEAIKNNNEIIIIGETGSGKTTQIPQILAEIASTGDKVAITEPRRMAARSVARYVAKEMDTKLGDKVGYQVRFDDQRRSDTQSTFMTDGILLRKLQHDPLLQEYDVVMVDEAHERNINIDFVLGLLKEAQRLRAQRGLKPLKIIVASATLDKEKFEKFFCKPAVVEVPGRVYPIKYKYERLDPMNWKNATDDAFYAATRILENRVDRAPGSGDILVFLPGVGEIRDLQQKFEEYEAMVKRQLVERNFGANIDFDLCINWEILPLYGNLDPEQQDEVFKPSRKRRVILATNIAETSVTVPNVTTVIDTGYVRQTEFNPATGIEALETVRHSKSGCDQRAGRAGRTEPGFCWRLYTRGDYEDRRDHQEPEILRSNLSSVILQMKRMGIEDVARFKFIDQPDEKLIKKAIKELKVLGALDDDENLTEIGKTMSDLPVEPRIGRMIIEAAKYNAMHDVCAIAGFVSARSVYVRPQKKAFEADAAHEKFKHEKSDFIAMIRIWREYQNQIRQGGYKQAKAWAHENFFNNKVLSEISQIYRQLTEILYKKRIFQGQQKELSEEELQRVVAAGLLNQLLILTNQSYYGHFQPFNGASEVKMFPGSGIKERDYPSFVTAKIFRTSKTWAALNQLVHPDLLLELAPQLLEKEVKVMGYDSEHSGIMAYNRYKIRGKKDTYLVSLEEDESFEAKGETGMRGLASAICDKESSLRYSFHRENIKARTELDSLWVSSGKEELYFIQRPPENLEEFYFELFKQHGIDTKAALDKAIEEGQIDFGLNKRNYLTAEAEESIVQANTIVVDGVELKLKIHDLGNDYIFALADVSMHDLGKLTKHPGNYRETEIPIVLRINGSEVYPWDDFDGFKRKQLFDYFRQVSENTHFPVKRVVVTNRIPKLPDPVFICEHPFTGEDAFAYPCIHRQSFADDHDTYLISYTADKQDAERSIRIVQARIKENIAWDEFNTLKDCTDARIKKIEQRLAKLSRVQNLLVPFDELQENFDRISRFLRWNANNVEDYKEASNDLDALEAKLKLANDSTERLKRKQGKLMQGIEQEEESITEFETQIKQIDEQLAEIYQGRTKGGSTFKLNDRKDELEVLIAAANERKDELEMEWLEIGEKLEA